MGIFSTSTGYSSGLSMNMDNVVPAFESANYTAMSLTAVAESQANYNNIIKAIGINELAAFEETGAEIIYEAGAISGFIAKIKQFFIKLWDKVKEIFHKFFAWLDVLTKDNKEFAKKYEAEARKRWNNIKDEFSIKGYKFTHLEEVPGKYADAENFAMDKYGDIVGYEVIDANNNLYGVIERNINKKINGSSFEDANKAFSDKHSDAVEAVRGAIKNSLVGGTDSGLTADEFTKELFEGFRDGDSSKTTLEKSDIDLEKCLTELKTYSKTKKDSEDAFKVIKKSFDNTIKKLEDLVKDANKLGTDKNDIKMTDKNTGKEVSAASVIVSYYNHLTTAWKDVKEVLVSANGTYLQALKDRATQDKTTVAAVITTGKIKKESADYGYGYSYNESASTGMSFLDQVVLK